MRATRAIAGLVIVGVIGCGGSHRAPDAGATDDASPRVDATTDSGVDGGGADAGTVTRWTDACGMLEAECMEDLDCARLGNCYAEWWVDEAFVSYQDCRSRSCVDSDDSCAEEVRTAATVTDEGRRLGGICAAKATECMEAFLCEPGFFSIIRPELHPAYEGCYAEPCVAVRECVRNARPMSCAFTFPG
jgi:hypothetical protein